MPKTGSKDAASAPDASGGGRGRPGPTGSAAIARPKRSTKAHLLTFALAAIIVWAPGTYAFIYFMPRMYHSAAERLMTGRRAGTTTTGASGGFPVGARHPCERLDGKGEMGSYLTAEYAVR